MFDAHKVINEIGLIKARHNCVSKHEHLCINAAEKMLSIDCDEPCYSSVMVTSLPHREPKDESGEITHNWSRQVGDAKYILQSGLFENGSPIGVPYGSKGRLALINMHTKAITQGCRILEAPPSINAAIVDLGMQGGGMTYKRVTEQMRRATGCQVTIINNDKSTWVIPIVDHFIFESGVCSTTKCDLKTMGRSQNMVLSNHFYGFIQKKSVRISKSALNIISANSWAIDLYTWLAGEMPLLLSPREFTWSDFFYGSGLSYKRSRQIRGTFNKTLELVKSIYPEARVDINKSGFVLFPCCAPI